LENERVEKLKLLIKEKLHLAIGKLFHREYGRQPELHIANS